MVGMVLALAWTVPADARPAPKRRLCPKIVKVGDPPSSTTSTTVPCRARERITPHDAAGPWNGTFDVRSLSTVPNNSCTSTWDGKFTVRVRDNGTVIGKGDATATEPPQCASGLSSAVPIATHATLLVSGGFTGTEFRLRFTATALQPSGFEAGFHVLYYPGPPTVRVPLVTSTRAVGEVNLFNSGSEELRGGGGTASLVGRITLVQESGG
jgi:hypothetical protein